MCGGRASADTSTGCHSVRRQSKRSSDPPSLLVVEGRRPRRTGARPQRCAPRPSLFSSRVPAGGGAVQQRRLLRRAQRGGQGPQHPDGTPYFKVCDLLNRHRGRALSSNYALYGVLLDLAPAGVQTGDLFAATAAVPAARREQLLTTMDRINGRWGRGTLRFLAEGLGQPWRMRRDRMSPSYTTDWQGLPIVR